MSARPINAPSISAFFPCYNDAPTIGGLVQSVAETLGRLTDDFEVIVINDGSHDNSDEVLAELQGTCPYLRVITHPENRGYGGALRSGFAAAGKDLVFYTDGDGQYDPCELADLVAVLEPQDDVVQGWKIKRHDPWYRRVIGWAYCEWVRLMFGLQTRDVDCDFRLIRGRVLENIEFSMTGGSITVELVARIERAGFNVREVGVHHYPRSFGRSQFFSARRVARTLWQLAGLWLQLHMDRRPAESAVAPILPALPQ